MSLLQDARTELDRFAAFCGELKLEDGRPLELYAEQRWMLDDYFDGVRELAILIPKKNGKSTLIAALALYHLVVTDNAECIIVAASREQAEILLRQARMFVRQSTALKRIMDVQRREIVSRLDEGRIRVLASDADTADGTIPTLAIVDELHRHKSFDLFTVLRQGLGPRNGRLVTISTAGTAYDSPLGELRQKAHEMEGFSRDGTYNHVRAPNFAFHEWCLDPEADVHEMEVVKTANPAPWHTVESLRERHDSPSMTTWDWLRFACGIWTEGEEPWLEPEVWDGLVRDWEPDLKEEVWLGVDVGNREEASAIALVARRGKDYLVEAHLLPPNAELEQIEARVRLIADAYRVVAVAYDPRPFNRSAEMFSKEGLTMLEFPQSAERMAKASATLWRLIERKELHHSGAKDFRAHVMAGVVKKDERGWRLMKDPRTRRPVQALIAMAMAIQVAADRKRLKPMIGFA